MTQDKVLFTMADGSGRQFYKDKDGNRVPVLAGPGEERDALDSSPLDPAQIDPATLGKDKK